MGELFLQVGEWVGLGLAVYVASRLASTAWYQSRIDYERKQDERKKQAGSR